jgi:hypothetical protein
MTQSVWYHSKTMTCTKAKPAPFMLSREDIERSKHERDESLISPFGQLRANENFRRCASYCSQKFVFGGVL